MRGQHSEGAGRLGGWYEKALHAAHNVSEGVGVAGSAARMASGAWRLAKDAKPETPPEKKLSDEQRAALEDQVCVQPCAVGFGPAFVASGLPSEWLAKCGSRVLTRWDRFSRPRRR